MSDAREDRSFGGGDGTPLPTLTLMQRSLQELPKNRIDSGTTTFRLEDVGSPRLGCCGGIYIYLGFHPF